MKNFIKKNWVYIALLSFIILINVLSRFAAEEKPKSDVKIEKHAGLREGPPDLFVDFEEAKERSEKIENVLRKNLPLYLFYLSVNLSIVFLLLAGFAFDGYFLFKSSRKVGIFRRMDIEPPLWRVSEVFKIVIIGLFASYIFFIAFGSFVGLIEALAKTKFGFYKNENFRMIFDTIVLDSVILLVILGFLRNVHKKTLRSMGFAKKNIVRNIFYGVSGYIGVIPIIFVIGLFVYIILNILKMKPPPQPIVGFFLAEKNVALIVTSGIIASLFGPVIEEIFFRGVMYNAVKRKLGKFRAILITSVLFSFLHTHAASYFLVGFAPIAILGAALAYLYEKTGSLIPSIALHILNNVGSVIMVFTFRYFNNLV